VCVRACVNVCSRASDVAVDRAYGRALEDQLVIGKVCAKSKASVVEQLCRAYEEGDQVTSLKNRPFRNTHFVNLLRTSDIAGCRLAPRRGRPADLQFGARA
jgi:hypothetical protein